MSTLMSCVKIEKFLSACCSYSSGCVLFQPQLTWVHNMYLSLSLSSKQNSLSLSSKQNFLSFPRFLFVCLALSSSLHVWHDLLLQTLITLISIFSFFLSQRTSFSLSLFPLFLSQSHFLTFHLSFSLCLSLASRDMILINIIVPNRVEITSWCYLTHTEQPCLYCSSFSLNLWPFVGCMVRRKKKEQNTHSIHPSILLSHLFSSLSLFSFTFFLHPLLIVLEWKGDQNTASQVSHEVAGNFSPSISLNCCPERSFERILLFLPSLNKHEQAVKEREKIVEEEREKRN